MKIEQLEYIVEISNSGSITTAAEKLHVSQPSISQSLASLEKQLQITIFKRSRSGAQPTEAGKMIIEKAREILNTIKELENAAQTQHSLLEAHLSIVSIPSLCMMLLPKTLGVFKSKFPNVQIEIIESGSNQISEFLAKGKVDLGLVSHREQTDFSDKFVFEELLAGKVMAYVGKKHALAGRKSVSVNDILKHPIVLLNQEYRMHSYMIELLNRVGKPNIMMTAGNPESLKRVVAEGLAIGFNSDVVLKTDPFMHSGDIQSLEILEQNMITRFGVLFKKNQLLSPASKEFINELKIQAIHIKRAYNLS